MSWDHFTKEAELHEGDIAEQTATAALARWAASPAPGIAKEARETLCASLTGARLVDAVIAKLACTEEERAFLYALNAEAAGRELQQLTKQAFFGEHPRLLGAGIGAALGAGLGAYKDDENRLRGAALYAVPGAAIGAIGGSISAELAAAEAAHVKALADEAAAAVATQRAAAQERAVANAAARLDLARRVDAATQHHETLIDAAHNVIMTHPDANVTAQARNMIDDLTRNRQEYIAYGVSKPGEIHPNFLAGYVNLPGDGLKHVLSTAKKILPRL